MTHPAFAPDDILTGEPTRSARLKWVIVVDDGAPLGQMVNAVACISASTGNAISGLIGPTAMDATGSAHEGLPWAGCSVLSATAEQISAIRARAAGHDAIFVADMPLSAQTNRVYDEYLAELSTTRAADVAPIALSMIGPRAEIDAIVKRLSLLA